MPWQRCRWQYSHKETLLCSRLSSSAVRFYTKIGRFAFLSSPLGDLGATFGDHLRLIGKRVVLSKFIAINDSSLFLWIIIWCCVCVIFWAIVYIKCISVTDVSNFWWALLYITVLCVHFRKRRLDASTMHMKFVNTEVGLLLSAWHMAYIAYCVRMCWVL